MSGPHNDMDDIVQSFVHTDLASLDRIGGEPESFSFSPHLTEKSPSLQQHSPENPASTFTPTTSQSAREGPELSDLPHASTQATHKLPETPEEPATTQPRSELSAPPAESAATASQGQGSRQPSASGQAPPSRRSSVRNTSTSSTTSTSTQEREKRGSLGDKFKMFGKRITSGGSKK